MKKLFIACLGTETNTFSNMPTGLENFEETMLFHGDATEKCDGLFAIPLKIWRRRGEAHQAEVVESLGAFAQPAGPTVRKVYEGFRDEILTDLKAAMPVDVVMLSLHGAMVAEGYDDCEGDLIENVRAIVGPEAVIGAELDLHCSITEKIVSNANIIITFKEYPHIDAAERAEELFDICLGASREELKPVMAVHDLKMISMWRTPVGEAANIVAHMQDLEGKDGILSVSLAHGFPWGDVPDASAKVLVVADGDAALAGATADAVGEKIWSLREATHPSGLTIDQALDHGLAASTGPIVMADLGDNAGVGAPSDSTFFLRRILQRQVPDVATGIYWDPVSVRFCMEAGEGATIDLRIGGKVGVASGDPVDLVVTVRRIVRGARQRFGGSMVEMGNAVWVSAANGQNLDLTLNDNRVQTFHPDAFEQFGIDLSRKKIVVVKSTQHFFSGFEPMAAEILYVAAPGAIPMDFADIEFKKFQQDYWPRHADPHG
jgi:microcystin degradation protein MlrC